MKDLITTIGSIMILMVFVMQFCSNQVIASKILALNSLVDTFQGNFETEKSIEDFKSKSAECVGCEKNEISLVKKDEKCTVKVPIKNVIACGKFLGISEKDNISIYTREVYCHEKSDNNPGNSDSNDFAQ